MTIESAAVKLMNELADASEDIILEWFRKPLDVETKFDGSPVTIADRMVEEQMRERINERFPTHGVLGEEYGHYNPDAEYQWVLDPIDGTQSFVRGVPLFGTLIAFLHQNKPILGLINLPALRTRLIGNQIQTQCNGSAVMMRRPPELSASILLTTDHRKSLKKNVAFHELVESVGMYRTWGDCFGYTALAAGYADIMLDPAMHLWDIAALIPVIRGAGGIITSWEGMEAISSDSIIAAHPDLHSSVLEILALHKTE